MVSLSLLAVTKSPSSLKSNLHDAAVSSRDAATLVEVDEASEIWQSNSWGFGIGVEWFTPIVFALGSLLGRLEVTRGGGCSWLFVLSPKIIWWPSKYLSLFSGTSLVLFYVLSFFVKVSCEAEAVRLFVEAGEGPIISNTYENDWSVDSSER